VLARITRTSHIDQLHRLSAFWEADVIHVMERGRLVESGD
jgi:ABC-type transport system involved in Fe-S cluster assembly fused permease/ATPase subunit